MAVYTLLDYVQTILSSLDSDEVNSYSDTVESVQVTNIVKTCYNDILARVDLPEHYSLFELNASGDPDMPVLMTRPSSVLSLQWLKYNTIADGETTPNWRPLTFMPIDKFQEMQYQLSTDEDNVESFDYSEGTAPDSITFLYRTDKAPQYFTTFNDSVIIFDSHDIEVDSTLQKTKTLAYGKKDQTFTLDDEFVPFLDPDMSTLLLNESKVLAFSELKQVGHDIAKQWATRGWTKIQKSKRGINNERNEIDRSPNYGRK
jgi:hypothetical protein